MAVALVTGANGVTGSYMVERILAGNEFARCVGTSRRPPNPDWVKKDLPAGVLETGGKLSWATADLAEESVEELTRKFVEAGCAGVTVLYWGAYVLADGWGHPQETEINKVMFDKCVRAVVAATNGGLKRVLLQLGEKWYWRDPDEPVPALPQREIPTPPTKSEGPAPGRAPFYTAQYNLAVALGRKHGFTWTVTLPMGIYGWTRQSQQSFVTSLAVFVFAHKLLGKPLVWPGNIHGYRGFGQGTDARLLADLNLWASLSDKCAGEVLNAASEDIYMTRYLWPRVGAYFGCEVPTLQEMEKLVSGQKGTMTELAVDRIPYDAIGPAFEGCKKSGIGKDDPSFDPSLHKAALPWDFLQYFFNSNGEAMWQSMTKVRRLGYTRYWDAEETFYDIFDRMVADGVFPKTVPGRQAAMQAFKL
ncbi:hypothetical protein DFJ74DRAFT_693705 [Hyaloraphidium curvatum]|nr:hypothetical protein DFJ74DRAFT_693705 [Hyaloraphidium curvatum]